MTDKVTLTTLLGDYPNTRPLKAGTVHSDLLELAFADVKVSNTAFKPLVRDGKFDAGELAIVTYLQAKAFGKPYVLLPATIVARGQHHTIAYNPARGPLSARELNGCRIATRAYTVTTGVWVRGILAEDYGVDLDSIEWVTFEDGHLAEQVDPPNVTRAGADKTPAKMLLDGEVDAAIVGDVMPDPALAYLIPDHETAARAFATRHGGVPINHLMVVRQAMTRERPDLVRELFRLLKESKQAANLAATGTPGDPYRFGVEAMRETLGVIIDYSFRQKLIPRRYSVDELFDDVTRALV